jgi:hypothetical protein
MLMTSEPQGCGECSACCFLLSIDDPKLKKEFNSWCPHCRPGCGGCSIYQSRPDPCRAFKCQWLYSQARPGQEMPLEMRPDNSGVMFMFSPEAGPQEWFVHVHPHRPLAWRRPKIRAKIDDLLQRGATVIVIIGRVRRVLRANQPVIEITDPANGVH